MRAAKQARDHVAVSVEDRAPDVDAPLKPLGEAPYDQRKGRRHRQ